MAGVVQGSQVGTMSMSTSQMAEFNRDWISAVSPVTGEKFVSMPRIHCSKRATCNNKKLRAVNTRCYYIRPLSTFAGQISTVAKRDTFARNYADQHLSQSRSCPEKRQIERLFSSFRTSQYGTLIRNGSLAIGPMDRARERAARLARACPLA